MRRLLALSMVLGCSETPQDSAQPEPGLAITSPDDGAWLDLGTEVTLEAEAWSADGSDADASAVQWQIGEWTGQGSPLSTTDLPAGSWTVEASLELEGQTVTDSVEVSVWAR